MPWVKRPVGKSDGSPAGSASSIPCKRRVRRASVEARSQAVIEARKSGLYDLVARLREHEPACVAELVAPSAARAAGSASRGCWIQSELSLRCPDRQPSVAASATGGAADAAGQAGESAGHRESPSVSRHGDRDAPPFYLRDPARPIKQPLNANGPA